MVKVWMGSIGSIQDGLSLQKEVCEPLALLGETIEEIEPQLTPALDELIKG